MRFTHQVDDLGAGSQLEFKVLYRLVSLKAGIQDTGMDEVDMKIFNIGHSS